MFKFALNEVVTPIIKLVYYVLLSLLDNFLSI